MRRHHTGGAGGLVRVFELTALAFIMGIALIMPMLPARAATNHVIEMKNFAFNPQFITINSGDSVQWYNNDTVEHTATANSTDPEVWTNVDLGPGTHSDMIPLTLPGPYNYICTFHFSLDNMWGRITVEGFVPEFSSSFTVVAGMLVIALGLLVAGRRRD